MKQLPNNAVYNNKTRTV